MKELLMEYGLRIAAELIIMVIGSLAAWVLAKLGKQTKLDNINLALSEMFALTETTVMELEQTYVKARKAMSADGKLTKGEVQALNAMLLDGVKAKLSETSMKVLTAAGTDIKALILGAGEAALQKIRK